MTSSKHEVYRNLTPAEYVQHALLYERESMLSDTGALVVRSGAKTGRSPLDKRIVDVPEVHDDVWWGKVNIPISDDSFSKLKSRALGFHERCPRLYYVDCFAGHDAAHRLKVRIVTTRAYHGLFMRNMLIVPTPAELESFGEPDYTVWNAGEEDADMSVPGVTSKTSVCLHLAKREVVILGTQYAGEMKKGVLTIMMYLMAKQGHLCMHASANEGPKGDVTVFFGLSGTGKTTLSADPTRPLIGDDEHVWTPNGVFNVEGGCYAKAVGLGPDEPDILGAVKFGAVAENVRLKPDSLIDFNDVSLTPNTRVAYPLHYIANAKQHAVGGHPHNVIFLTNDAFGVLPPVSKLTLAQASFWFVTGYTAVVPGTVVGVKEPKPTFSPCFGGPFLVFHPLHYGKQLAEKLKAHDAHCWLVNTGWSGGPALGENPGKRMKLKITRSIIDAIHDGTLEKEEFTPMPGWHLNVPRRCRNVPDEVLDPFLTWKNKAAYVTTINKLAVMFQKNFKQYADKAEPDVLAAVPGDYERPGHAKL